MRIAVVTSDHNGSPKVLAGCLDSLLRETGRQSDLFYRIDVFKRLLRYDDVKHKYNAVAWELNRLLHTLPDKKFIKKLKTYDAVIIVETSPRSYLKDSYNFIKLKSLLGSIPILYYGVYYLGNAPTMVEFLRDNHHHSLDIFDWHLSVSEVTEIRQKPEAPWSQIGLHLKSTGLKPMPKKELFGLVDFAREGFDEQRQYQIKALEELNIPYIELKGKYSITEIREYYQKATFYFMASGESFGVPIAECLSGGCYILTPDTSWPMAWRLDENLQIHGPGTLADCFVVYDGAEDLTRKLRDLKNSYDLEETPKAVFNSFYSNYPYYYEGNVDALNEAIEKVSKKQRG